MLCPLCAKENKDDARFCGNCGGSLHVGGSGDVLEDVLGLGLPRATPPSEVGDVGLHDLFQSLSARKTSEPEPAAPSPRPSVSALKTEQAVRSPAQPSPARAPGRSLTIEDIIASAPTAPVTPPMSMDEATARQTRAATADPTPGYVAGSQLGPTPPPMPRTAEDEAKHTRVPVARPPAQPAAAVAIAPAATTSPSRLTTGLLVTANLALLGAVGEMVRQLYPVSLAQAAAAAGAALVALLALAIKPSAFGGAHLAKVLLGDAFFLAAWAHENGASLAGRALLYTAPAGVVLTGVFVALFVFAGLEFLANLRLAKPVRWVFMALGVYSCAGACAALAQLEGFDRVLAGEGLAKSFPPAAAFLEPTWVGVNGLLPAGLVVAWLALLSALRQKQGSRALSMALTVVVLWNGCRLGVLSMESSGRPGLRSALARAGEQLMAVAASHGVALPEVLPPPKKDAAPAP